MNQGSESAIHGICQRIRLSALHRGSLLSSFSLHLKREALFGFQGQGSIFAHFRQIVSEIVVELALRRYLNREEIPHRYYQAKRFTDPDRL